MDCILCGKELENSEGEVCETCFNVLKSKYKKGSSLMKRLKWHKKQAQKLKEELK